MQKKVLGKLGLHKSGCYFVRVNGKMRYLTGTHGTQDEAELALARLRVELSQDTVGAVNPNLQPISSLFSLYLDRMKGTTSDKNWKDKERILSRFVKLHGEQTPSSLTPLQVEDFINAQYQRTTGAGRAVVYAHLAACFRWLTSKVRITENPMVGLVRQQVKPRSLDWVVEPEEWDSIVSGLDNPYNDVLRVLYLTGARPTEIIKARVDEWDATSGTLQKVQHKTAHKGRSRIILAPSQAGEIINRHIAGRTGGLIFLTKKKIPVCHEWLRGLLVDRARAVGRTKPICLYSARHSFAVRHLRRGIPINLVADWLGNTVAICERSYGHGKESVAQTRAFLEG